MQKDFVAALSALPLPQDEEALEAAFGAARARALRAFHSQLLGARSAPSSSASSPEGSRGGGAHAELEKELLQVGGWVGCEMVWYRVWVVGLLDDLEKELLEVEGRT